MILVNKKQLDPNRTDPEYELAHFARDYRKCLEGLRKEYDEVGGKIRLQRVGWPKKDSNGFNRPVPPIHLPYTMAYNGEIWEYCKTAAITAPNGLMEISEKYRDITGLSWTIDINKEPDLAVYFMCKTPFINKFFVVKDPAKEATKKANSKREALDLQMQIYRGLDDDKLRIVAASWGVDGAMTDTIDLVRENLENKVLAEQKRKDMNPEIRTIRGIKEFLEDVKGDQGVRRRAALQYAIDSGKMQFDKFTGFYHIGDRNIVYVPATNLDEPLRYAGEYFGHSMKKEEWDVFLKDVVDEDFVKKQDKQGAFWLAKELGLNVGVKISAEEVKALLLEYIAPKE